MTAGIRLAALATILFVATSVRLVGADDAARRLIIVANSRLPESVELAHFYAGARAVPEANIIALPLPEDESITWRQFIDQVWQPLQDELFRRGWLEGSTGSLLDRLGRKRYALTGHRISYLVVCRGVPLRIFNDPTLLGTVKLPPEINKNEAAVDSELSLLASGARETAGLLANPLFEREGPVTLDGELVVKVCRLDGPTWQSARELVNSALKAEASGAAGRYYVDLHGPHPEGDTWLRGAADELRDLGFDGDREDTERTFEASARFDAPLFYFGWYADTMDGPFGVPGFVFPRGAVALHIHSYSAHTLHNDRAGWCGPLVARGVAATVGNVFEPYLSFTHRPGRLVHALAQGKNFGDAAYYALPALSWQGVAIGDPLYTPFRVSLGQQLQRPSASVYAVLRQANLWQRAGQADQAIDFLRQAQAARPDPVLALGLAEALSAAGKNREAADVVKDFARPFFAGAPWPLVRDAAQRLARGGDERAALEVYRLLADRPAPSLLGYRAMLAEARDLAEKKGEPELASDFERRRATP